MPGRHTTLSRKIMGCVQPRLRMNAVNSVNCFNHWRLFGVKIVITRYHNDFPCPVTRKDAKMVLDLMKLGGRWFKSTSPKR